MKIYKNNLVKSKKIKAVHHLVKILIKTNHKLKKNKKSIKIKKNQIQIKSIIVIYQRVKLQKNKNNSINKI